MTDRGNTEGLDGGLLGAARIVPSEAVFDGATGLAHAVADAIGVLAVGEPVRVAGLLQRLDQVRRGVSQVERAVVAQAARSLGVEVRAARVEPRIRMLNAATNARREVLAIASVVGAAIEGVGSKLEVLPLLADIQGAIEELQKLARLVERAADAEGRAPR